MEWSRFPVVPLDDHQGVILDVATLPDNDPEVKKVVALASNALERDHLEERLHYFSSWHKAKRAEAVCMRLKGILLNRVKTKKLAPSQHHHTRDSGQREIDSETRPLQTVSYRPIDVEQMQRAEQEIIKHIRKQAFGQEIAILKSCNNNFDTIDHNSARAQEQEMKL